MIDTAVEEEIYAFEPLSKERSRIKLTVATSNKSPLNKSFTLEADGNITKSPNALLISGHAEVQELRHFGELPDVIERLQPNQALILGIPDRPKVKVVSAAALTPERIAVGYVARTKEYFACANHGLVLFDYDEPEHTPDHLRCGSPGELMQLLARIPELEGLQFYALPSSSAGIAIAETGEAYRGNGMHVYVETKSLDLTKFHRWAEVKFWDAGWGYITYAANGALLVRHVIDLAVLSPERLVFEARPHLGPGLVQAEREFVFEPGKVLTGDFDISPADYARHVDTIARAKADPAVKAKAERIREDYIREKGLELAAQGNIPVEAACQAIRRNQGQFGGTITLPPEYALDIGGRYITVADLAANGKEYDKKAIPDPIEGRAYGSTTAKFYFNDGEPIINSHAHGVKTVYKLPKPSACQDTPSTPAPCIDQPTLARYSLNGSSQKLAEEVGTETFVLADIALFGQWTHISSAPNCGKTLLALSLLLATLQQHPELQGKVYYINADDSKKGLAEKTHLAEMAGFHMLAPGMNGFELDAFLALLADVVAKGEASGTVIFLDTLKKFVDVQEKARVARFGTAVRQFVQHGGTLITLGHVNKHRGANGKVVIEGTADIRNDADCTFTLEEIDRNDEEQEKVVRFENIKARGGVASQASYRYSTASTITYTELLASVQFLGLDYTPPADEPQAKFDETVVIAAVIAAIQEGVTSKLKLRDVVAARSNASKRQVLQLIEKYSGADPSVHRWNFKRIGHGKFLFTLLGQ
jgi:hypothetical protein